MAAASATMALSGVTSTASVNKLSSSVAFGSSGAQQFGLVRSPVSSKVSKCVVAKASLNSEERKPEMLVALVAAGAALALNVTPASPAYAGFFDKTPIPSVERNSSSNFPGNEGTGNNVGSNSDVRGSAGTPFGEGAGKGSKGGSNVGFNAPNIGAAAEKAKSSVNQSTPNVDPLKSVGALNPFKSGTPDVSVPNIGAEAEKAKSKVEGATPNIDPLKSIGDLNPFKGGVPDVNVNFGKEGAGNNVGNNSAARGASSGGSPIGEGSSTGNKTGLNLSPPNVAEEAEKYKANIPSSDPLKSIGDLNPFKSSIPDASGAASDAKSAAKDAVGDVKSKTGDLKSKVFGN